MCVGYWEEGRERGRERERGEDNTQGFAINPIYPHSPPVFAFIICAGIFPYLFAQSQHRAIQRILDTYPPVYSP